MRPLTLLGVDDVETLAGMVAAGTNLVDVFHEKIAGGYRELSLGRFLHDRGDDKPPRLPMLSERWLALTDECFARLGGEGG